MPSEANRFRRRLAQATGLSDSAITAAWPEWWSDAADASASAQAELRFSIARKLGLDPTSLLEDQTPRFIWDDAAKYKNFSGDAAQERPAVTSFGISLARMLLQGVAATRDLIGIGAAELRGSLLARQHFIRLEHLLALLWGMGVPTIHLRVYPLAAKRMCAMSVRAEGRSAFLLAKDSQYPAWTIFHLAHEIGHVALGHVGEGTGLVDMEDPTEQPDEKDEEEIAADAYALELLTGEADFTVRKEGAGSNAAELARGCRRQGEASRIEPGTLALCYGHSTGEWATVQAALPRIYDAPMDVWSAVNHVADQQLDWNALTEENTSFLRAVMGAT